MGTERPGQVRGGGELKRDGHGGPHLRSLTEESRETDERRSCR